MAIERLNYQRFTDATDPAALSVTIPSGTDCIVFAAAYYDSDGLTSVDLDGSSSFTINVAYGGGSGRDCVSLAHLFVSGVSGSHTINVNWASSRDYTGGLYVIYYSGVRSSGLRDSDSIDGNSLTLTTVSGDRVVAVAALDMAATWTNCTEIDDTYGNGIYGTIADMTADGTSEVISVTDANTALAALVLIPSAAASGNPWYYYAQQLRSLKDKWRGLLTIPSLAEVKLYGRMRHDMV